MKIKEMLNVEISNIINEINLKTKFVNSLRIHDVECFKDKYNLMVTKCFCHFTYKNNSYTVEESYNYFSQDSYMIKNLVNDIIFKCAENEFDKITLNVFEKEDWVNSFFNNYGYYNDNTFGYKQLNTYKDKDYIFYYEIHNDLDMKFKEEIIYNYIRNTSKNFIENKIIEYKNNKLLNKIGNKNNITKMNKI